MIAKGPPGILKEMAKIVAVEHKWYLFAWKSVSMWTYVYKEKKMSTGFTMAKIKQQYYDKWQS